MPRKRKIFYGWWLVGAAAVLNYLMGGTFYYGLTVYFNPIRNTFGWTSAATSVAFTLQRLETGVMAPVTGYLADNVAPRKLMLIGWTIAGSGFLWMSRIGSVWEFYGAFLVTAIGFSLGAYIIILAALSRWFIKKRSRAMTSAFLGAGLSGTVAPLSAWAINSIGWQNSLALTGIGLMVIALPLCWLFRKSPEQYGYLPDGETKPAVDQPADTAGDNASGEATDLSPGSPGATDLSVMGALRTSAFWFLALAFFFQQIGMSAVMVHIVPYLETAGIATTMAATVVTGMTLTSLAGRLSFGFLGDFIEKRYLIATAFALQTVGIFIFSLITADNSWLIIPFLIMYAPGYGGAIPLRPALQADYFGTKNYGTIMGVMSIITMMGGLTSPIFAGWIFDTTGSYNMAWKIFAVISIPAIPAMLFAKSPLARQERA